MYSVLYQVIGFMYRTVLMYSVLYQVIGFMYHTVLMYSVLYQVIAFVCRTGTVHCTGVGSISALADRRTASFELLNCKKHVNTVHQDGPLHGRTVSQDQKWPSKLSEQLVNKSYTESGPIFHVDPNAIKSWHPRYQRS